MKANKFEKEIIEHILKQLFKCVSFDETTKAFTDGGNFIISLSKDQLSTLISFSLKNDLLCLTVEQYQNLSEIIEKP